MRLLAAGTFLLSLRAGFAQDDGAAEVDEEVATLLRTQLGEPIRDNLSLLRTAGNDKNFEEIYSAGGVLRTQTSIDNGEEKMGGFTAYYANQLRRAPLTPTLRRAIVERAEIERSGLAPVPQLHAEYRSSSLVRTGEGEGVCRISFRGVVCEKPTYREVRVNNEISKGLRRGKRKKRRKHKGKRKKSKGWKKKGWKDNGKGMMCNGWRCKPKPTKYPTTTTQKKVWEGQLNDEYGRIDLAHLKTTLIEMNSVHPLERFMYLNLNGNWLVGDLTILEEIICMMPNIRYVTFQACGMRGTIPPDTFRCAPKIQKVDFSENGIWCLKGAFEHLLEPTELSDGRFVFPLKVINLDTNPLKARCYFDFKEGLPLPAAKMWDYLKMVKHKRTDGLEFSTSILECLDSEPNCVTNRPDFDEDLLTSDRYNNNHEHFGNYGN
jgi:hypothetical protein